MINQFLIIFYLIDINLFFFFSISFFPTFSYEKDAVRKQLFWTRVSDLGLIPRS